MLAGCAATDVGELPDEDAITEEEIAAGEAWLGGDGFEPDEHTDEGQTLASEETEPSASFLEDGDESIGQLEQAHSTCRRATGYRRGRAFSICVTSVEGKLVEVNTARRYLNMKAAARRAGVRISIVSAFRTMATQRYLYNCYRTKRCNRGNLAAPPGYSNHQSGSALDLNTSARGVYSWLSRNAGRYGFRRTVPSERWHWER
jgi:hypothetical protein